MCWLLTLNYPFFFTTVVYGYMSFPGQYCASSLSHSLAGVSRSVTLVVAYIMTVTKLGWSDALAAVKAARSSAAPNLGFQRQLQEFESSQADQVGWGGQVKENWAVSHVVTFVCVRAVQRMATDGVQGQPLQRRGSYT